MNNFVFSQDPLLFQSYQSKVNAQDDYEMKQKQLNDMMAHYQQMQQNLPIEKDHIGELDTLQKSLRNEVAESLINNEEYRKLNDELQGIIQAEIMNNIKWKINNNPNAIRIIDKQKEIINDIKNQTEEDERRNLTELNDYMKNYSNITFDEYKKLKSKKK